MEISEGSLRQMVREVDDLHREGMRTIGDDIAALHTGAATRWQESSRRRFLRHAGTGLAVVLGGTVVPVGGLITAASAQTLDDPTIAKFAESVELAAVAAYTAAAQSGKVHTPAVVTAVTTFAGHHMDHAKAFGALAGDTATAKPNPGVLQSVGDQIREAPDEKAVLQVAYATENAAAATYLFAIGALTSIEALAATASIMPVEAQHAAVLGYVLGKDPKSDTEYLPPFQTPDEAIQPSKYPIAT
ncbi:MAG: ferritin-like domain-containing protein [Actinomycetota bacterium]|nr:ferritin-like domain-containing protein [Actinomycetota bacterium]